MIANRFFSSLRQGSAGFENRRPPIHAHQSTAAGDAVEVFSEKAQIETGWINGGFFVLEPGVLEFIRGDETQFEREPLEALAQAGQLMMYRHEGFWSCMDTLRDVRHLNQLWNEGRAPWRSWK